MHRRQFITGSVVGGVGFLAGCGRLGGATGNSGGNSGSGSGPPNFDTPSVSAPTEVAFGTEFHLTVSISNTGAQDGKFTGIIRSTADTFEYEEDISMTVASGETASTETEAITLPAVGEYSFVLSAATEYEVTTTDDEVQARTVDDGVSGDLDTVTVTVTAQTLRAGESIDLDEETQLQIDSVSIETMLFGGQNGEYPNSVIRAEADQIFAVYEATIKSTGDGTVWRPSEVTIPNGSFYDLGTFTLYDYGENLASRVTLDGGETRSGFFFTTYPREEMRAGAPLEIQTDTETSKPEYKWEFDVDPAAGFPEFQIADVTAPKTTPVGEPFDMTVTIANRGESAGTVRGLLQTPAALFGWDLIAAAHPTPVVEAEIDPGSEEAVTFTYEFEEPDEGTLRLSPFEDTEWEVTGR